MKWRDRAPWVVPLVLASLATMASGGLQLLCAALALVVALVQPLVLRPRRAVLLPAIAATLACAVLAAKMNSTRSEALPPSLGEQYAVPLDPPGPRTMSLRSLQRVPGARVLVLDAHERPSEAVLRAGEFQATFEGHPTDRDCFHVFTEGCLFDAYTDVPTEGAPIEIRYVVRPETRGEIEGAKVLVTVPFSTGSEYAGAGAELAIFALVLCGATLVGLFGLVVAWAKWRSRDASQPEGPRA